MGGHGGLAGEGGLVSVGCLVVGGGVAGTLEGVLGVGQAVQQFAGGRRHAADEGLQLLR